MGGFEGFGLGGLLLLELLVALDDLLEGMGFGAGVSKEPHGPGAADAAEEGTGADAEFDG